MLLIDPTTHTHTRLETTAERIAEIYVGNFQEGYTTSREDLLKEGFTQDEINAHDPAAQRIAKKAMSRELGDDPTPPYDRVARVIKAADLVVGFFKPESAFESLRKEGYPACEIGNLWPEIMAVAGDKLAELKAAR